MNTVTVTLLILHEHDLLVRLYVGDVNGDGGYSFKNINSASTTTMSDN